MAYTVAQAEVTVLPDAKNFGRDLRAQISPEAEKIGRDIGDELVRGLRERLATAHPDVQVGADTTEASAKVDEFLTETKAKAAVAGKDAGKRMGKNMADEAGKEFSARTALIGSAVALGLMAGAPLIVGAAGVLFGGLAGYLVHQNEDVQAAATSLATGVSDAYKTVAAQTVPFFVQALDQIRVAAVAMAPSVGAIFSNLQAPIQGVTQGVIRLAQNVLPGLTAAIAQGQPVFRALATVFGDIGSGLGNFFQIVSQHSDAMGTSLSALGAVLQELLTALGTLAGAGSELGSIVLPALATALSVINDVLQFIAPVLPEVVLGFLAWKAAALITPLLGSLAGALDTIGLKALYAADNLTLSRAAGAAAGAGFGAAATGARTLEGAMGPIGWIMAGISLAVPLLISAFNNQKASQQQVKESAQAMTEALRQSKGAIDDNVRAQAALEAQNNGLLEYAKTWGVASSTVVDAILGVPSAMAEVNDAAQKYQDSQVGYGKAIAQAATEATGVQATYNVAAGEGTKAHEDLANASKNHLSALSQLSSTTAGEVKNQDELKTAIGGANGSLQENATRLKGIADTAGAASSQVNQLKTALDALTGKAVSLGDAEVAVTNAVLAASTALKGKSGALTDATGAVNTHTEAGAALWSSMTAIASADNKVIATMEQHGATTAAVAQRDAELRDQFIQTATQMGLSADQAHALADQIYGIPDQRKVEITADTQTAEGRIQAIHDWLQEVKDKHIKVTVDLFDPSGALHSTGGKGGLNAGLTEAVGGLVHPYAAGGLEPMPGGVAQVVKPNTWRVIGDNLTSDEAYIPINDSARSLAILAQTAGRMGYGLAAPGGAAGTDSKTDARQYHIAISAPSDPWAIAAQVRDVQRDLEFLHG